VINLIFAIGSETARGASESSIPDFRDVHERSFARLAAPDMVAPKAIEFRAAEMY
jgi:hypothetical protein